MHNITLHLALMTLRISRAIELAVNRQAKVREEP